MVDARWDAVDAYFEDRLVGADPVLLAARRASRDAGLPPIEVAPTQGKLLHLLARAVGARRILEVGTLGAYSTIWLARALPADGRLVTLELDAHHAEVARVNLERAGLDERVEVRVGPAAENLEAMVAAGGEPFDFAFIDADKPSNARYVRAALALGRPGGMIVVDNVVRNGEVADPASSDPSVAGVREVMDLFAAEPRLDATAIQTVGAKGYDGLAVAVIV